VKDIARARAVFRLREMPAAQPGPGPLPLTCRQASIATDAPFRPNESVGFADEAGGSRGRGKLYKYLAVEIVGWMVNQLVEIQGMRDELRCTRKSIVHFSRRSSVYIMPMQKISEPLKTASCSSP
jgi:hypothetical protein